jgi:hypothetical protein
MKIRIAVLSLTLMAVASAAYAQEITATITGTVRDETGAGIPSATIEVFNTDKNLSTRTLSTAGDGQYVVPLLHVGKYSVRASAPGFQTARQDNITLTLNDRILVDFRLRVGVASEVVTVTGEPSRIDLETPTASRLISGTEVRETAIMTRNFIQLVPLQPGVSSVLDSDQPYVGVTNPNGKTNFAGFSINGARPDQNSWLLDGATNLDRGANESLLSYPSIDSIQEFNVLRSNYNAEFGGNAGAQISVITRSGTRDFHGSAYEFLRNDVLAANNYFNNLYGIERPPLRYNNFGYTVGGPVYIPRIYEKNRSKTFFFFSQEWRKAINHGTYYVYGVPTLEERQGKFATPICIEPDPWTGNCMGATSTQIANIDPTAAAYIQDIYSKLPEPNPDNTLFYAARETFDFREESVRVDHIFNSRFSIFGRFINDSIPTVEANGLFCAPSLPGVQTTATNAPGRGFTTRLAMVFNPNLLNEVGYSYSYGAILSHPIGTQSSEVSTHIRPELPFPMGVRVPSLLFLGSTAIDGFGPFDDVNRQHTVFDTLTKVHGRHTLKFGGLWNHYEKQENTWGNNNGIYVFVGNDAEGNASFKQQWANFLSGNAMFFGQFRQDVVSDVLQNEFELFAQDIFRIRPNLTLSYGLRWSIFRQPTDGNGYASTFDPSTYDPSAAAEIDINTGDLVPGTETPYLNGMIIGGVNSPYGGAVAQQNNRCFAPRVGFAWDPFSTGKTSVRGGYGMFYESVRTGIREQGFNPPFSEFRSYLLPNMSRPTGGIELPNLTPQSPGGPDPNWEPPYVQQWSLGVQRQLWSGSTLEVGYHGSKGTHLVGLLDVNQPIPGAYREAGIPGPITVGTAPLLNYVRPYQGFGSIQIFATAFDSNYHSFQTQFQQDIGTDSFLVINYTWSHALTNSTHPFALAQNSRDLAAEYGEPYFDRRHIFSANYIYYLPFFRPQKGAMGKLLGGWELSGAVYVHSGLPATVFYNGTDPAGIGLLMTSRFTPRPDQLGDANQNAPRTLEQWFDTSVFAEPPADGNRPGNARNGSIKGPGAVRWDASLFKNTRMGEQVNLQLRLEASNVLNHTNFNDIVTNLQDPRFGQVTSSRDARIVQLGVKIIF